MILMQQMNDLLFLLPAVLQDFVLVVPESSYSSSYLNEEPLDKSYDFISNCGQNSFHIKSVSLLKTSSTTTTAILYLA